MEKLKKYLLVFLIAICSAYTIDGFAQTKETKLEREVVIVKKTIDENGNETVEKTVYTGDELSDEEIEKMFKDGTETVEVEVENFTEKPKLGVMVKKSEDGKGVKILEVVKNSPAELAGFMAGDIITAVGEQSVRNPDQLIETLKSQGLRPYITLIRDGEFMAKSVIMGSRHMTKKTTKTKKSVKIKKIEKM